ncbi:MAG: DUF445 family protein [Acidobacteria bacterium]|nr:MAG: DUF445 family protein [Acidobacteriota bacterium]REJ98359.1 MAG: DUF445 family protein [Acidobacteriota bacterium]REK17103.1 MAG: DUF445 family protein [Acidobacteriota bacterium]REK43013.1 MAG: DUF445 family protein [Acidobacteriota bacterium]
MDIWQTIEPVISNFWFHLASLVVMATLHGYLGAWLAVRMLFRPRKPVKLIGITLFPQGMIPRHRARLAKAIGKAVGEELVSQETVLEELFEKEFLQKKIRGFVDSYARELMERDHPSLIESVPEQIRPALIETVATMRARIGDYVGTVIRSEQTSDTIRSFVGTRVDEMMSQKVSDTVSDETFNDILQFIETRIANVVHEPALEKTIASFIGGKVDELVSEQAPLSELFTDDAISLLKEKAFEQIDPVVHQLAELATEDRTKDQISALIKKEVHDYYEQLPFFKKIFVSRDNLLREVDDLVDESLPKRIEETLKGDFFAVEAKSFVGRSIDNALSRPLPEIIGQVAPEQLDRLKAQLTINILRVLQGEQMRKSIAGYLADSLETVKPRLIGDLLQSAHPEAATKLRRLLTDGLIGVLEREETAKIVNEVLSKQIDSLLNAPIGRLSRHVSEEQIEKAGETLTKVIIDAAKQKLPEAIEEFDIGGVVEEKVNNYPAEKLEALVLSVAKDNLRMIELFGAFFGFFIGFGQSIHFYLYFTYFH